MRLHRSVDAIQLLMYFQYICVHRTSMYHMHNSNTTKAVRCNATPLNAMTASEACISICTHFDVQWLVLLLVIVGYCGFAHYVFAVFSLRYCSIAIVFVSQLFPLGMINENELCSSYRKPCNTI